MTVLFLSITHTLYDSHKDLAMLGSLQYPAVWSHVYCCNFSF